MGEASEGNGEAKRRCCQNFKNWIVYFDQVYFSPVFV